MQLAGGAGGVALTASVLCSAPFCTGTDFLLEITGCVLTGSLKKLVAPAISSENDPRNFTPNYRDPYIEERS